MKFVEPKVFVVAKTEIDEVALKSYLGEVGAPEWTTDATGGQKLIEVAGRICYKAFGVGLNPNVVRVREGNELYIGNLLAQNHGSVLEHVTVSFIFYNVSRVFTHELVTHRVGTAKSQESGRYVTFKELAYTRVPGIEEVGEELAAFETAYTALSAKLTGSFTLRKRLTSLFRRFLPQGGATSVLWTANLRTLRHVIQLRTGVAAEVEIREVFQQVAEKCKALFPAVFQDMCQNDAGEWVCQSLQH